MMVRYTYHKDGRRMYVFGKRLHHGTSGIILAIVGLSNKRLHWISPIGMALFLHDVKDFPFTDKNNH